MGIWEIRKQNRLYFTLGSDALRCQCMQVRVFVDGSAVGVINASHDLRDDINHQISEVLSTEWSGSAAASGELLKTVSIRRPKRVVAPVLAYSYYFQPSNTRRGYVILKPPESLHPPYSSSSSSSAPRPAHTPGDTAAPLGGSASMSYKPVAPVPAPILASAMTAHTTAKLVLCVRVRLRHTNEPITTGAGPSPASGRSGRPKGSKSTKKSKAAASASSNLIAATAARSTMTLVDTSTDPAISLASTDTAISLEDITPEGTVKRRAKPRPNPAAVGSNVAPQKAAAKRGRPKKPTKAQQPHPKKAKGKPEKKSVEFFDSSDSSDSSVGD